MKKPVSFMWSVLIGLVLVGFGAGCKTRRTSENYTQAYMNQFWQTNVRHQVMSVLHNGVSDIPEIDVEVKALRARIREVYGTELSLRRSTNYCAFVPDPFDAYVQNGVPTIEVSVPALVDLSLFCSIVYDDQTRYEMTVLIYLCHQLERLAYNQVPKDPGSRANRKLLVERQQRAWMLTCSVVIVPLVEKYHAPLFIEERDLYELWIRSVHSTQTPLWNKYIRKRYMSYWPP